MRTSAATAVAIAGMLALSGTPAQAAKRLSVSATKGLDRAGQTVTVTGRGYDVSKGIYVAFCVDNGAGVMPSPCGGGADMTGGSGTSAWISSNPPSYGEELARPYGGGGSFTVTLRVSQMIGEIDCVVRGCAVVTRNDHTRTGDRSQDVRVPVRFAAPAGTRTAGAPARAQAPAPGKTQAPATKKPVGPPTGRLATQAPTTEEPAAVAMDLQASLNRTTRATPLGHWWAIGGAFVAGLLAAVVAGRIRRRRNHA
ncbi:hypothetical protein [Actinoplanes sp. NPDC051494]|uniref:hypothetical protein n=1 Tax=Actinoplanes sp. NPDC051494 TaxID=3363907 RepID=UPI0037B1A6C4